MPTFLINLLRWLGMLLLVALALCIIPQIGLALVYGPATHSRVDADDAPSVRETLGLTLADARIMGRSALVAGLAAVMSLAIAIPAVFAAVARPAWAASRWVRGLLAWPLLAPPSVVAYAWTLLATQRTGIPTVFGRITGWNSVDAAPLWAGWMQAVWLWPIPALTLAGAFMPRGLSAYRMALLDAGPWRAFRRAALPAVAGPLAASLALVFLLAVNDASIPPLAIGVGMTWPVMMLGEATRAATLENPTAYLLWRSWPMIALTLAAALVLWRGLRPTLVERETADLADLGTPLSCPAWLAWLCVAWTAGISLFPMAGFAYELASLGGRAGDVVRQAALLYSREWKASWIVAVLCGAGAFVACMAMLRASDRRPTNAIRRVFNWRGMALAAVVLLAALPPVVIGQSLIATFDQDWMVWPRLGVSLYDNVPVAPVLGVLARYLIIGLLLITVAQRLMPVEHIESAMADGATDAQAIAGVRMPALWRTLAAVAAMLASLGLSELAISSMVEPVRFGGSLAVAIDRQIHFGRNEQVIATSLMLTLPALATALAWPTRRRQ